MHTNAAEVPQVFTVMSSQALFYFDILAFFNRLSLVDPATKKRLLPVFYSDNYVSVLPGETKTITLEYTPKPGAATPQVSVSGWNTAEKYYEVAKR